MASKGDAKPPDVAPETAPDPDEDDLDDLDEMLDEFSAAKISPKQPPAAASASTHDTAPQASGPGRPITKEDLDAQPPVSEEDFAKQLQQGMAEMLKELEADPQMAKEFEEMMAQFGGPADAATAPPPVPAAPPSKKSTAAGPTPTTKSATPASKPSSATAPSEESFQETIRKTLDRMKASSSSADAAASQPNPGEDDMMAALMREMGNLGEGDGDSDAFSKMLLGMMEQLTNKEILYEPMKELDVKFPSWLEERTQGSKKGTVSEEEMARYQEQRQLVRDIVAKFEKPGYSDENTADREYIVEKMQKMQAAGAPPPELVGDTNAAMEMMGDLDSGCAQQ